MHIPVGRRPAEALGLKVRSDLEEKLKAASLEEMEGMHKLASFKKGSAMAGVAINASLASISPTNMVGTALNMCQGVVAHIERKKIEKAAQKFHVADFREGDDRVGRKREEAAGAAYKTAVSAVLFGQDDLVAVISALGGDLACPSTGAELAVKEASDAFHGNSFISNLQEVGSYPASLAQQTFGIDHNPTWGDLSHASDPKLAAQATAAIGVAVEANVVMLAADVVGQEAHKQITRDQRRYHMGRDQGRNDMGRDQGRYDMGRDHGRTDRGQGRYDMGHDHGRRYN